MVFVSHDLALVAQVANSITVMYAGQVVEQGSVNDILTNPIHEYTRGLLGSVLSIEAGSGRLHQVPGLRSFAERLPEGRPFRSSFEPSRPAFGRSTDSQARWHVEPLVCGAA